MPAPKRQRIEPTDDWQQLSLLITWPEQLAHELIRPVVLFGFTPGERPHQTGNSARTIHRKADRFGAHGMASLSADFKPPKQSDRRSLPLPLRQLIVDRKTEYPAFRTNELATLCFVASGRRPSSHTIKRVLATGPRPTSISRLYPRYHQFSDEAEGRLAIIRLHAEGWNVKSIAGYLETTRRRVHETLHRWATEGVQGLKDKPPIPKNPRRKVDLRTLNEVRKLQEKPEPGEFRVHAALLQFGIKLSPLGTSPRPKPGRSWSPATTTSSPITTTKSTGRIVIARIVDTVRQKCSVGCRECSRNRLHSIGSSTAHALAGCSTRLAMSGSDTGVSRENMVWPTDQRRSGSTARPSFLSSPMSYWRSTR